MRAEEVLAEALAIVPGADALACPVPLVRVAVLLALEERRSAGAARIDVTG